MKNSYEPICALSGLISSFKLLYDQYQYIIKTGGMIISGIAYPLVEGQVVSLLGLIVRC